MATKNFKGFQLVTKAQFEALGRNKDLNTLYFVRTNEAKSDGFLYFNGKKYGTAEDVKAELTDKYGELSGQTISDYVAGEIAKVNTAAGELGKKVDANTKAIEKINGDETIDGKPYSEIIEEARMYILAKGGFEKFAEWGLF